MGSDLEHANITVTDVDEAIRFFTTAMPDFRVRYDTGAGPGRWAHLGTDVTYISINQISGPAERSLGRVRPGYNHIGFIVDDADAVRQRMLRAGYREGFVAEPHPYRKRVYFIDGDGMEYEFVQYCSHDVAKRNDYEL